MKMRFGALAFLLFLPWPCFAANYGGLPTVQNILKELEKPGRAPHPEFKAATFAGIGVHQDGLVHVPALSTKVVKDPREVVKAGDIVKVKVLEVDLPRSGIALTMRMSDARLPYASTMRHPPVAVPVSVRIRHRRTPSHPTAALWRWPSPN